METAYVGIATRERLEVWVPETAHAVEFLLRRTARIQGAACFWAVVPDQAAAEVAELLSQGLSEQALRVLDSATARAGRILPEGETLPVIQRAS